MKKLERDRVLVVGPKFFGYSALIAQGFSDLGVSCLHIDVADGFSFYSFLRSTYRRGSFDAAHPLLRGRYKLVLVVKGTFLTRADVELLRGICDNLCLWLIDDFRRFEVPVRRTLQLYDHVFTFQQRDVELLSKEVDSGVTFLPVGHGNSHGTETEIEKKYDISFVGNIYGGRAPALDHLVAGLSNRNVVIYGGFNVVKGIRFLNVCYRYRNLARCLKFGVLPRDKALAVFRQSRVVLNLHSDLQTGLSTRVFECIEAEVPQVVVGKNLDRLDLGDSVKFAESIDEAIILLNTMLAQDNQFKYPTVHSFRERAREITAVCAE